jgi:PTS system nitrogen regulatory IIA component
MYLNQIQIAESFGVEEKVVEDWIRNEGLPHTVDRGRYLFDRVQVADWAAARGLAAHSGFLAPQAPSASTALRLGSLLRAGGIWRGVAPDGVLGVLEKVVRALPGTVPAVQNVLIQRMRARDGVNFAPIGRGLAVPHLSARVALGRDGGTLALLLLDAPLALAHGSPDGAPVTRLLFFIAPSARAHLDMLGRICRALDHGPLPDCLARGAADAEILSAVDSLDAAAAALGGDKPR